MLAPAGNFPSPARILSAHARFAQMGTGALVEQVAELEQQLESFFSITNSLVFGLGREALLAALLVLKEERGVSTLALSAFTCPDVVASAARAGVKIHLVDIDGESLDLSSESLGEIPGDCVLLLSNLFGLVDRIPGNLGDNCFLIDDSCQASLSRSSQAVGARGHLGLVSFGRGKPLCGAGAGALLFPSKLDIPYKRFREQRQILWGGAPGKGSIGAWVKATLGWALERPQLYWLPASMPFLRLGESYFDSEFPTLPPSIVELSAASACMNEVSGAKKMYLRNKSLWNQALKGLELIEPVVARGQLDDDGTVLTRYPIVFPSRQWRERAATELHHAGLGVSRSYNRSLLEYDGVENYIARTGDAQASSVATRLVTMPMHSFVLEKHIEQAVEIIRDAKQ